MTRDEVINGGIRYLAREIGAEKGEFRRDNTGGDMLLTALLTGGYARQKDGMVALTETGHRRLADVEGGNVQA